MLVDSIYFKGHTCFKDEWSGFDTVTPVNVIIGPNNSGKSHLLDLVAALCAGNLDTHDWQYRCRGVLDEKSLRQHFDVNTSLGRLGGNHWADHGRHFVDKCATWTTDSSGTLVEIVFADGTSLESPYGQDSTDARRASISRLLQTKVHRLTEKAFRHLLADRDIGVESPSNTLTLGADGRGASNIVRRFITTSNEKFPREVIQKVLLTAINEIFDSDGQFTEIHVKEHDEENVGSVHHPRLLRRLFQYLEEYAMRESAVVFLTTHSSTALDFCGTSVNAQIIQVTHNGESARAVPVNAHFDRLGVMSELGARPSDLLQSNGIVWVEGPSDRVYINRWIQLCSDDTLREGRDFQCAFYGGALLARTQFTSPEDAHGELVNLFRVNPNVVVICDSDRSSERTALKRRTRRIREEVKGGSDTGPDEVRRSRRSAVDFPP